MSEGIPAYETEKVAANIRNLGLENDGKSRQLARYVKEIGERYVDNIEVVLIYRNDRFLRGGDHTPYVQRGFAAVRITEMNENYTRQHQDVRVENGIQYGDLEVYIDYEYLRKNTGVNLANLANLSKAPAMPDSVKMEVKKIKQLHFVVLAGAKDWKSERLLCFSKRNNKCLLAKKNIYNRNRNAFAFFKRQLFFCSAIC